MKISKNERAKVYLVGAGPGDPALLTLRAVEVLAKCDVVLYDRLIDTRVLKHATKATLIPVGKRPGQPADKRQNHIQHLMIRYSYAGLTVVRLKGGDPFIFGRGGEEALSLAKAKVPFELVPGISSFFAAPELAGIPLTHRKVASSFGVFTAHEASSKDSSVVNWEAAAKVETAVFLMGVQNLSMIIENLLKQNLSPLTPVAIISRASSKAQEVRKGTLENIVKRAIGLQAPATLIVGEVVNLETNYIKNRSWSNKEVDSSFNEELEFALRGEVLVLT